MRKSEAVHLSGPGRHVPKFSDVLGAHEKAMLVAHKLRDRLRGLRAKRMVGLGAAEENIGIDKDTHQ